MTARQRVVSSCGAGRAGAMGIPQSACLLILVTLAIGPCLGQPDGLAQPRAPYTFPGWEAGALADDDPGAIRWAHADADRIAPVGVPGDWKGYNLLSFTMACEKATGSRFMVIIQSENEQTAGTDYYMAGVTVDFEGAREVRLGLLDDVGSARSPLGWDQITGMFLTASGWGNVPDPETVVTISDMKLSWEASQLGPRMTDEELFGALDLDYPGLEKVKLAVQGGDLKAAKAAFVEHIKSRRTPKYYTSWEDRPSADQRPAKPNTRQADAALALTYTVCGVPLTFEDEIDWTANPTDPFNPEWTWQFGRFSWWGSLVKAYWETEDRKYASQFVRELRSWVQSNPMPRNVNNGVGSRWRTIECGIRLAGSWPNAFFRLLGSPDFPDDDAVMMVKSFAEQAEYLHKYPTGGNWLTMEANGMGHVGVLFPEFKRAQAWRGDAVARLYKELDSQVYPDGAQKELTTGYHYVALGNFLRLARINMFNALDIPADYVGKLERMWAMGMWAMTPDRALPLVNDAWHVSVPRTLREALEFFPNREDFTWVATDGKEGAPPEHTSHFFPWAGWAVMRSGWGRDDNYLFLDVGPFGLGHQHEDKLAFLIHAYGADLLVDVGSYAYERSKMRSYVVGPYAHNIVFVDGKAQHRRGQRQTNVNAQPQQTPWYTTDAVDYCEGVYEDGFGGDLDRTVTHKRQILFVKPEYWIVLDTLTAGDDAAHDYQALFHLGTPTAEASGPRASTLGDEANLHIYAAGQDSPTAEIIHGQEEPYYLGWIGKHGVHGKRPMPVARYTWTGSGTSHVLYAFYPTPEGRKTPITALTLLDADGGLSARLQFEDDRQDTIKITDAEWTVTQVDAAGDTVSVRRVAPGS